MNSKNILIKIKIKLKWELQFKIPEANSIEQNRKHNIFTKFEI